MTSGQTRGVKQTAFVYMPETFGFTSVNKRKNHNYTHYESGIDYVFEAIDASGAKGYMTGQGKGVKQGDGITLKQDNQQIRYQVERIDYYASPSDMWIALLVRE